MDFFSNRYTFINNETSRMQLLEPARGRGSSDKTWPRSGRAPIGADWVTPLEIIGAARSAAEVITSSALVGGSF